MNFDAREVLPGVFHIADAMGVCMTLVTGSRRALLVDTGYGVHDAAAFVRSLTDLPLTVMLTHGHHDHALGARWFCDVRVQPEDFAAYAHYTDAAHRQAVLNQALAKGLSPEGDFLGDAMPAAQALCEGELDLGGLTARVIRCPGHTPGSAVVYVPERKLLLSGDTWNPCTWLFFPEALPARDYRRNARSLLALGFDHVLCPHRAALYPRASFESAMAALTDEALSAAPRVTIPPYDHIDTHQAELPGGQVLVFDRAKFAPDERNNANEDA